MIYLEEKFREEANSIIQAFSALSVPGFHDFQLKLEQALLSNGTWSSEVLQSFETFRKSAIETLETKTHDWIDIYIKLTKTQHGQNPIVSNWPIVGFLITAIICLLGSAVFHTFYCLSQKVNKVLIRIDYAGICFLICGSTYAP